MKGYVASAIMFVAIITVLITAWLYVDGHLNYAFVASMVGFAVELAIIAKAFGKKGK